MSIVKLARQNAPADAPEHMAYDLHQGTFKTSATKVHYTESQGGYRELSEGDYWGVILERSGQRHYFHNARHYPDTEAFVLCADILGRSQIRLRYFWEGKEVETTVYQRVSGVGINPYEAKEEDVDMFLRVSAEHMPRRAAWPDAFSITDAT